MLLRKGAQRGLKSVEAGLNLHRCCSMIAEAAPFRASRHVHRRLKSKMASEAPQIIGHSKCARNPLTVLVKVQIRQEQTKPFHESGQANVACLAHFLHGPMQVFEATIEITCSVGHAAFGDSNGGLIQETEVFGGQFRECALPNRLHGRFWKTFEQLCGLGRQSTSSDPLEALDGTLHPTATGPSKAINLHAILVDEDRDVPVMEEAHITTSKPWAKTLRSEHEASEASKKRHDGLNPCSVRSVGLCPSLLHLVTSRVRTTNAAIQGLQSWSLKAQTERASTCQKRNQKPKR